jgi:hypothetical protein
MVVMDLPATLPTCVWHERTALAYATAIFGAGEADLIAQRPQQRHVRLDIQIVRHAIDLQTDHCIASLTAR